MYFPPTPQNQNLPPNKTNQTKTKTKQNHKNKNKTNSNDNKNNNNNKSYLSESPPVILWFCEKTNSKEERARNG